MPDGETYLLVSAPRIIDRMVIGDMIEEAKASVPTDDLEAATSAFLSEVVLSRLAEYFPWVEPGVDPTEEDLGFSR